MARSSDRSLLGVVNSLSPSKMLFAPARKQSACPTFRNTRQCHGATHVGDIVHGGYRFAESESISVVVLVLGALLS